MEHGFTLISTLAVGFGIALIFGFIAERLRVPALVGYLLAGVAVSPATPGYVADISIASQLSEIGVMLLMFGVGLHFSLADLLRVKHIAVPGAVAQMGVATILGMGLSHLWGWSWGESLVFGMCLSCASTVVLLKALEAKGILESHDGQIAVGWLVVEDIMTVLLLVLLPPLASMLGGTAVADTVSEPLWWIIGKTIFRVICFIALMLVVGKRVLPWLLWQVAKTGSRELFTLCVLAVAIGIAYGAAQVFDVSFALGAFFSGMVMRESKYSHRAAMESLPLRDAFSVIFFVGVGMMFDPSIVVDQPLHLLGVLAIILVGKSLIASALVLMFGYALHTSLTVAAALAQIGEFSFILAGLGVQLGLLPPEGMSLVLAGAILSIAINPLAFAGIPALKDFIKKRSKFARIADARPDPMSQMPYEVDRQFLEGHLVLVGYRGAGRKAALELRKMGISIVVVDKDRAIVEELREKGVNAISGDATDPSALIQAHIADCSLLLINTRNTIDARKIIEIAKLLNPNVEIILRADNDEEAELVRAEGHGKVFFAENELASALTQHIRTRYGKKLVEEKQEE